MKISIQEEKENPLLNRKEMKVLIQGSTPPRKELIKQIAAEAGADIDSISIDNIRQEFGGTESVAYVKIYKTEQDRARFEKKYKLERTEGKKEKPAEDKKKE